METVKIHVKKIDGLVLPKKANPKDAAYDVYATSGPFIKGIEVGGGIYSEVDYIEYGTNLFVAPQDTQAISGDILTQILSDEQSWWIQGLPRSSASKYNLLMANSCPTVDNPYRGEIKIRFKYVFQPIDYTLRSYDLCGEKHWEIMGARVNLEKCYRVGDRIAQVRPVKNVDINWVLVDKLDETVRNEGGFGSSGQ